MLFLNGKFIKLGHIMSQIEVIHNIFRFVDSFYFIGLTPYRGSFHSKEDPSSIIPYIF